MERVEDVQIFVAFSEYLNFNIYVGQGAGPGKINQKFALIWTVHTKQLVEITFEGSFLFLFTFAFTTDIYETFLKGLKRIYRENAVV